MAQKISLVGWPKQVIIIFISFPEHVSHVRCRWQAERRKHYPTAANQEKKAQAATDRQARGELEPDQALRRQRLQEVRKPPQL